MPHGFRTAVLTLWLAGPAMLSDAAAQSYTADQQALCTDDAFRLCRSAIPDVDRVTACMVQNHAMLSPGCAQFIRPPAAQVVPVSTRKPIAKPRPAKAAKQRKKG